MAIKINAKYTPRANAPDANYPEGSIKNEFPPAAGNGTPLDQDWGNDYEGFTAALLAEGGVAYSGNPDTVLVSDRLTALKNLIAANFNTQWPVGSVWQSALDGANPPGTGIAGVVWSQPVTDGSVLMTESSGAGGQLGANPISTSATGPHTLTVAEMPSHAHTLSTLPALGAINGPYKDPTDTNTSASLEVTQSEGGDNAHTHPLDFLRYVVKTYVRTA